MKFFLSFFVLIVISTVLSSEPSVMYDQHSFGFISQSTVMHRSVTEHPVEIVQYKRLT